MGLLNIGQPKAGETVVVAAASGAVGSVVGQIAKLKGCRVVSIAGGAVFDAVLPLLSVGARVPLCGMIAHYNDTALPTGPDRLGLLTWTLLIKRIKMQGFIIFDDYGHRYGEFFTQMSEWLGKGQIKFREDIVDGLDNAPQAFIGLLEGKNFGKLVVRVAND